MGSLLLFLITLDSYTMANCLLIISLGLCLVILAAETSGECVDKHGCKAKIDTEGPTMCNDPQAEKDCCLLCKAYKNWTARSARSACVDRRGCKAKIDAEGPTMCNDPQAEKDCCLLCKA